MTHQIEYKSMYLPGLNNDDIENINADIISSMLRERTRVYNRLGSEGWTLIAEHMDRGDYSAIATFRRMHDMGGNAAPANQEQAAVSPPPGNQNQQTASYPTLQPDPAAPDTFRLVWEE